MFTGIIEEIGTVRALEKGQGGFRLQVLADQVALGTQIGQSICVNGACLTVVAGPKDLLCFELMPQTLKCTNLGLLQRADQVNLERALRPEARIDGHFVSGHIDGVGLISRKQSQGGEVRMTVEAPPNLMRYIALRGSVALDGVSLTISGQGPNFFEVSLIGYTLKNTTLGLKQVRDRINIECDILAKYGARFTSSVGQNTPSRLNVAFLKEHGFTP